MGCINSKSGISVDVASPVLDVSIAPPAPTLAVISRQSSVVSSKNTSGPLDIDWKHKKDRRDINNKKHNKRDGDGNGNGNGKNNEREIFVDNENGNAGQDCKRLRGRSSSGRGGSISIESGVSRRHVEAEQIAAGWPSWLSAAAGSAIHGWVPLKADAFEKLEKIGQGTYSSVFRARHVETGRMVALKKVRLDNFQPESIRFMAREIMILRRLDHPNIMNLEGIITSRLSSSIYLVFEYMEHDLAGLSSSPYIKFNESQVKCYMKQLLSGIEHCHLRGIIHRDIKVANILVNNEGILKLGDFGLANVLNSRNRQHLTSRVVTLWYRPPELLMGSTSYGASADLWSVGCVFAELFFGKPLLKGRTEIEQLHKIFKLCGSPPDQYWNQVKLPNASMFRSQHSYESSLRERCKGLPATAMDLMETLLSIEPEKRGTASSVLASQYFNTMPYACDPSSLPKYPPNKEMDAKYREDAQRKRAGSRTQDPVASRKPRRVYRSLQQQNSFNQCALNREAKNNAQFPRKTILGNLHMSKERWGLHKEPGPLLDRNSSTSQVTNRDPVFTGPVLIASSGFAWAKRRKQDAKSALSSNPSCSTSQISASDSLGFDFVNNSLHSREEEEERLDSSEATANHTGLDQENQLDLPDSPSTTRSFHSYASTAEEAVSLRCKLIRGYTSQRGNVEFSGALLSQSNKRDQLDTNDALLQSNKSQIRRAAHRSRLDRSRLTQ